MTMGGSTTVFQLNSHPAKLLWANTEHTRILSIYTWGWVAHELNEMMII